MNKLKYNHIISMAVLALTFIFLIPVIGETMPFVANRETVCLTLLVILLACVVYILKGMRFYFIVLERHIEFRKFILIYLKTTLVNLLLPFKLGELYRIFFYGTEFCDFKAAMLSVVVERYFDTVPLLFLLIVFTTAASSDILMVIYFLFIFIVILSILYIIFPSMYRYLNCFFVEETNSEKGILGLSVLEELNHWYMQTQELMRGRTVLLLIISSITWTMEYGILMLLVKGTRQVFHVTMFIDYMNSILIGRENQYLNIYIGISALLLIGAYTCVLIWSCRKKRRA